MVETGTFATLWRQMAARWELMSTLARRLAPRRRRRARRKLARDTAHNAQGGDGRSQRNLDGAPADREIRAAMDGSVIGRAMVDTISSLGRSTTGTTWKSTSASLLTEGIHAAARSGLQRISERPVCCRDQQNAAVVLGLGGKLSRM